MPTTSWADADPDDHEYPRGGVAVEPRLPPPEAKATRAGPMAPPFVAFVGNLPFTASEADVVAFFGSAVQLKQVRMPVDPKTERVKGFAYVEFHDGESLVHALGYNGQTLMVMPPGEGGGSTAHDRLSGACTPSQGRPIRVNLADTQPRAPPVRKDRFPEHRGKRREDKAWFGSGERADAAGTWRSSITPDPRPKAPPLAPKGPSPAVAPAPKGPTPAVTPAPKGPPRPAAPKPKPVEKKAEKSMVGFAMLSIESDEDEDDEDEAERTPASLAPAGPSAG